MAHIYRSVAALFLLHLTPSDVLAAPAPPAKVQVPAAQDTPRNIYIFF
jgi:hypothetical protein